METITWEDLSRPQKSMLASMDAMAGRGLFLMPNGAGQWTTMRWLVKNRLAIRGPEAMNEDTGEEGAAFNMTPLGARVAAQEPGLDRCDLPLPM